MTVAPATIHEALAGRKLFFLTGQTRPVDFRVRQLKALGQALVDYEERILAVLQDDLGKPPMEAYGAEVLNVKLELKLFLAQLRKWSGRRRISIPWWLWPARGWVQPEPHGVALILAAWNYPFQLALMPLVAAIAAGNCAVVKPSELAPKSAELLREMLAERLDPGLVSVVCGDAAVAAELAGQPFDFVFFTGGESIGRKVAEAAGRNLAPCVLELGGKNPCIVEPDAPLEITARRVAWGKFMNAGQTCLAPDHVWVHRSIEAPFLEALGRAIGKSYGPDPATSADYARIVNRRHFDRLVSYLAQGDVRSGGRHNATERYLEPTVLTRPGPGAPVMSEEIFGPILPVLPYDDLGEVLDTLRRQPAPLALYLHTKQKSVEQRVLAETRSGGVCINDHIVHVTVPGLPFGGSGASGMGRYHGRSGFDTFSQQRGVMRQAWFWDNPLRYPPGATKLPLIKRLIG